MGRNKKEAPRRSPKTRTRALSVIFIAVGCAGLIFFGVSYYLAGNNDLQKHEVDIAVKMQSFRSKLQEQIGPYLLHSQLKEDVELTLDGEKQNVKLSYTIEPLLQIEAEKLLKSYKPDYGAIVVMNAETGQILAMASFQRNGDSGLNLALRGTYPAASVFKIVTATAAIDKYMLSPDTLIMFNGGNHTLYKRNVMNTQVNRWTREMSLREAFARSINAVFGRISLEKLQPKDLREYAVRFGFNQNIQTDLPFDPGFTDIPEEKSFHLAEVASGFNRITTMSPIQGAMIAASIANDGVMRVPYIIENVHDDKGIELFKSEPVTAAVTMTKAGAERLKDLMGATVHKGTGRKSFRNLVRDRKFVDLEMGGKTGSLQGLNPKGKVDWFVGYAIGENDKIAVAALTVNIDRWQVKSAHLAQDMLRKRFGSQFSKENEKFFKTSAASTQDPEQH